MQINSMQDDKRFQAIMRAEELAQDTAGYLTASQRIPTGLTCSEQIEERKNQILTILQATQDDWDDWKWQLRNRIKDPAMLAIILGLSAVETRRIQKVAKAYRWAISPYYLSLIDQNYHQNPAFKQSVPDIRELSGGGSLDPMDEEGTSPAPCVTRRYPDRLIINVTNQCAMFCRHCQRRRNIGEEDQHARRADIENAISYIRENEEIRDVLITGGDALLLSDKYLDYILGELDSIPHVEIKRIGTRALVTMPQRVTPALCEVIKKHPPVYINTQFNHPLEITAEAKQACDRLVEAGAILGNQAVLLRGINDDPNIMRKLNHELLRIRVRPYYIFHPKEVKGTSHWWCGIGKGLEIIDSLRGHTSGLGVPTYIINAPHGWGKIPLTPGYLVNILPGRVVLRTWEGRQIEIGDSMDY
ncbi:MAG: glutamate 2,3-aminomutase [Chitinophagales bacterium]